MQMLLIPSAAHAFGTDVRTSGESAAAESVLPETFAHGANDCAMVLSTSFNLPLAVWSDVTIVAGATPREVLHCRLMLPPASPKRVRCGQLLVPERCAGWRMSATT